MFKLCRAILISIYCECGYVLGWLRATQAMALLGLLSHIGTLVGLVLAVKRGMRYWVAGCGQFAVSK